MKKVFLLLSLCFILFSCSEKVVYVPKPALTDTTDLKVQFKAYEWAIIMNTIAYQTKQLSILKDTAEKKKAMDTVAMALNTITKRITDTTVNQIFKQ